VRAPLLDEPTSQGKAVHSCGPSLSSWPIIRGDDTLEVLMGAVSKGPLIRVDR
jgi:hypothetical protein